MWMITNFPVGVGAASIPPADFIVTDTASMLSAFSSAVAGDVIEFRADIPAPASNTKISFAPGITVRTDGTPRSVGTAVQTAGYTWECLNPTGVTTKTTWGAGLTLHCKDANTGSSSLASFFFAYGVLEFRSRLTGRNGGTGRPGNQITLIDSASYPVIADLYGNVADTAATDLVSGIGYGSASGIVTEHHPSSRIDGHDLVLYSPGTGGTDNWFTAHQGIPMRIFGGTLSQIGGGPGVNSGPDNATMELYGVAIDVSNYNGQQNAIVVTKMVGCNITGSPTATNSRILLNGDANAPTERSVVIGCTSTLPIFKGSGHSLAPVIYRNTINCYAGRRGVIDTVAGIGDAALQSTDLFIARNTMDINSATVRNKAIETSYTSSICTNCDISIVSCSAGGRSILHPIGGTGNLSQFHSMRCTGANALFGIRVDTATNAVATDCAFLAATAAQFGGSAANAVNCTIDGSTPSGASIGVAGAGPQLTSGTGLAMVNALEAYLAANASGTGAGTGYTPYAAINSYMDDF